MYWSNAGSGGSLFSISKAGDTTAGAAAVNFSYLLSGLTVVDPLGAAYAPAAFTFTATAASGSPTESGFHNFLDQPNVSGSFSLISTTKLVVNGRTYAPGVNLLSGVFTNSDISGKSGTTSGNLDASNESAGLTLTYTSKFLNFIPTNSRDAALAFSAITQALFSVSPVAYPAAPTNSNTALSSFSAVATGDFSSDPAPTISPVPEPATWAMMTLGLGLAGGALRRRAALVAQPAG